MRGFAVMGLPKWRSLGFETSQRPSACVLIAVPPVEPYAADQEGKQRPARGQAVGPPWGLQAAPAAGDGKNRGRDRRGRSLHGLPIRFPASCALEELFVPFDYIGCPQRGSDIPIDRRSTRPALVILPRSLGPPVLLPSGLQE